MKCIHCSADTKYRDRLANGGACGSCRHRFAFEPKTTTVGLVTVSDGLFQRVLKDASGDDTVFFSERQLWYEFCRRMWRKGWGNFTATGGAILGGSIIGGVLVGVVAAAVWPVFVIGVSGAIAGAVVSNRQRKKLAPTPPISFPEFQRRFLQRWIDVHGKPKHLVEPATLQAGRRAAAAEPDLTAYSFDRAVITEHADTAAMLIANRFHFENNCAILSIGRYPESVAGTVLEMLRRNPRLKVFVVHDAGVEGCRVPLQVRAPEWFPEPTVQVVDLGLRPKHAIDLRLFTIQGDPRALPPELKSALPAEDAAWLESGKRSELASIRSAKLMRSIYQGFARANQADAAGDTWAGDSGGGGFIWIHDGGADLHAADSFG